MTETTHIGTLQVEFWGDKLRFSWMTGGVPYVKTVDVKDFLDSGTVESVTAIDIFAQIRDAVQDEAAVLA